MSTPCVGSGCIPVQLLGSLTSPGAGGSGRACYHHRTLAQMPHSTDSLLSDWTETASWYVEEYGWQVVPLHPNPKFSEQSSAEEVIRHVGYAPLWEDWEEKATQDLEVLEEWSTLTRGPGKRLPHVYLGAKTGQASNLLVLEVALDHRGRNHLDKWQRVYDPLPETMVLFEGRDRKYFFFTYPAVEDPLPRWFGGPAFRLHGEASLVRVPILNKRRSNLSWDIQGPEKPAAAPLWLLDHFGCLSADPVEAQDMGQRVNGRPHVPSKHETSSNARVSNGQDLSLTSPSTPSKFQTGSEGLPFRTGEALAGEENEDSHFLGQPWLVKDGLTVLTGRAKLAGKTTWTLNAAVHLVSGREFMGFPSHPCPVVVLTDVCSSWTNVFLQKLGGLVPKARSRLHLLHPKDVADWHWARLLEHTYNYAQEVGAKAIFIDSLDQYVGVQGDLDPTSDARVLHRLRVQSPSNSAVFAVKATQSGETSSLRTALEELSDLGMTADVIMQMAQVQASKSTLRRFVSLCRAGRIPQEMYGELRQGRYHRVRPDRVSEDDWVPTITEDSSRDARSPAPPLRTQEFEETTSIN